MNGLGIAIVSTSHGVMTDRKARATGVGGEVALHRRLTGSRRSNMSRIGNNPVKLPAKVEVTLANGEITVKGPLGDADARRSATSVTIEKDGDELVFKAANDEVARDAGHDARAGRQHGQGRDRRLSRRSCTLVGVGYRAQAAGDKLNLSLGFSHPVVHTMPKGVKVETPVQTEIVVKGIDKQAGRPGRRGDPRLPSARAVQGQGRALFRRARRDQGNEEEVSRKNTGRLDRSNRR